ncbi:MAG: peptidase [Planctomycetales bacterium]|nr:peptidase [Planctomycetales bacterium]
MNSRRDPAASTINRRSLLQAAGAAALASPLVASFNVHAEDKSGGKNVVIGEGEHQYECIHDWGMDNLPQGAHYGNASHGVTIDEAGLIYITHYGGPGSIFVFDPDGKFVKSMGDFHSQGSGNGQHGCGHGIDIRKEGGEEFLYLSASESSLDFAKINLKGELVWRRGRNELHEDSGKYPQGAAYRPTNASFRPDGGYYLGDGYGSNWLHHYDKDDKYVRSIGGGGTADGQFRTPHGQWLDDRDGTPKLVVADRANKRLQWFDMDGAHLKTLDGFLFPADIDQRGELLLVPDLHCRITLLDKENNVVAQLGDDEAWRAEALAGFKMRTQRPKWQPGKFIHPHDAAFDSAGNIFIAEWVATGRVTKLRKVS